MSKPVSTPKLPADAIGFVARRADRPERLALHHRNGAVSNSFAQDEDMDAVRAILARNGLTVDDAGIVRRVG